jgi:hypothetical protein
VEDRRRAERYDKWLPVRIDGESAGLAVTHNTSQTGAMMVTASTYEAGAAVRVTFEFPEGGALEVAARVVRSGPNPDDPNGLWPYSLALEFEEPQPDLEARFRQLP